MVLAIVAIVLSVASLYVAGGARKLEAQMDTLAADVNERLAAATRQTESTEARMRSVVSQIDGRFVMMGNQLQTLMARVDQASQAAAPKAAGEARAPAEPGSEATYAIKSGDTLERIAKKYGTTSDVLIKANPGIDPRRLKIDQKIKVPAAAPAP
jgi:LysM repeat protein